MLSFKAKDEEQENGSEYFTGGSIFGISVYTMTGLLVVIVTAGLVWQFRFQPHSSNPKSQPEGLLIAVRGGRL